jgi:hypothetical protein
LEKLLCAAISFQKKSFRKKFDKIENYELFHQHAARILRAPTVAITHLLQADIIEWLGTAGETRAASWFEEYLCGEKGYYTNTTAGYVGNCVASGIKSHWQYLKEETVGNSGTNQRMSLGHLLGLWFATLA